MIDLALTWTDPQYRFGSNLDAVVAATNEVLAIAHNKGLQIVFTTMAYDPKQRTANLYLKKIPASHDFR